MPTTVLRKVEQKDMISYGLIPEFVGRFPVICSLQVHWRIYVLRGLGRKASGTVWSHAAAAVSGAPCKGTGRQQGLSVTSACEYLLDHQKGHAQRRATSCCASFQDEHPSQPGSGDARRIA